LKEGTVNKSACLIHSFRLRLVGTAACVLLALPAIPAAAQVPQAAAPYRLSVFAKGVVGSYTQPDSIAVSAWGDTVFIGYGNGVAKDGSDGKQSTIVEYTLTGGIVQTFQVTGHNDGLKIDPETGLLWALQNEDGNPNLVVITPSSGAQTRYVFGPTGGGYDDMVFLKDKVFFSASNPAHDPNTDPAIVSAELDGLFVEVKPVMAGNAIATDIPTGKNVSLNLQDPDSLTLTPDGDLLLDSQADQEIVIVHHPGQMSQKAFHLGVTSGGTPAEIDDTVFSRSGEGFILVSDLDANIVYAIHRAIWPGGVAYSAANVLGLVGKLDLETGNLTPVVTGLKNPRGMAFVRNQEEEGEDR
jgi:hypothetical protein